MHGKQTKDRRIQRTEALLREAMVSLLHEKPYDDIAVKEILARANVGRSTFYTHFGDKHDLLVRCIHDVLDWAQPGGRERGRARSPTDLLWFSLPIFNYIEDHHSTSEPKTAYKDRQALHEHLFHMIGELIQDAAEAALRASSTPRNVSGKLLVQWIASTYVLVLNWWVESDLVLPADEADRLVRALVEPSLARILT